MNEILQRIIDIENEAKQIMAEIEAMKAEAPSIISEEKKLIEEKVIKQSEERIQAFEEKEKKRCEDTVKLQQADYEEKLRRLTAEFNKNRKLWEDEVYNRIITR